METGERHAMLTAFLEFRPSAIHGMGAFARRFLKRSTQLIEYVGEVIPRAESLKRCDAENPYIFTLDSDRDLDGSVEWNLARFINHSCMPNCDAEQYDLRIWIIARRDIQQGEEVTINYGYDLSDYKQYACHCGANDCVGYMVAEEFFDHIRKQNQVASDAASDSLPLEQVPSSPGRRPG